MFNMIEPRVECEELSRDGKYGRFTIEPLEGGYGVTIGNSLRRVLLSSLPGAAVTRLQIEGVLHEFSTIHAVREDVTDIILNIKKLVVKLHSEGSRTARIEKEGPGEVTGRDVTSDPDLEVLNPEVPIAGLDVGGRLFIELTVEKGFGYVTAENNKIPNQPIGVIAIDSRFTPVTKVNYTIEATRVEQRTDYDKLTLELWTDGSVRADEALEEAARILIKHFDLFTDLSTKIREDDNEEEIVEKSEVEEALDKSIEVLDLSTRSGNCLKRAGFNTIGDLVNRTEEEISKIRNMGKKSVQEVKSKLEAMGLTFRLEEE